MPRLSLNYSNQRPSLLQIISIKQKKSLNKIEKFPNFKLKPNKKYHSPHYRFPKLQNLSPNLLNVVINVINNLNKKIVNQYTRRKKLLTRKCIHKNYCSKCINSFI